MFTGTAPQPGHLDLEQVSLLDLARGALELSRAGAEARGVQLSCNCFHSFPPMLLDPHRITEAILSLVEPAVASAPMDSGVDLMLVGRNEMAKLVIQWRGAPGSETGTPARPLAERARTIFEAHGGTLAWEGAAGGGCTLTITLPVVRPAMQMDALDTGLHDRNAVEHLHVLLAEDNLMNRKLASSLLERKGHSVTRVATGREAVSAFLVGHFDLVLMDIQMPLMNGIEASELIRRLDSGRGRRVPIVALTAGDTEINFQRCREAGMDAVLGKPFRGDDFDRLLKKLNTEALEAHRKWLAGKDNPPA